MVFGPFKASFLERLRNDEELNKLKQEYEELTGNIPFGYNYDEYGSIEEYKQKYKDEIEEYRKTNK